MNEPQHQHDHPYSSSPAPHQEATPQRGPHGAWPPTPKQHRNPHPQPATSSGCGQYGGEFAGSPRGGSSYSGFDAFTLERSRRPRNKRKLVALAGGAAIVVVLVGGLVAWWTDMISFGDTLEAQSVEEGVTTVLTEHYGESDVSGANCPSGETVDAGNTFTCSVDIGEERKTVEIKVINDEREFEVGAPE